MLHNRTDTISPRVTATGLLAVVGTIIGASEPTSLQRGAWFVRGGHLMTLRYSMAAFAEASRTLAWAVTTPPPVTAWPQRNPWGNELWAGIPRARLAWKARCFRKSKTDTMTGFGNIGSQRGLPLVEFTSTNALDSVKWKCKLSLPPRRAGRFLCRSRQTTVLGPHVHLTSYSTCRC